MSASMIFVHLALVLLLFAAKVEPKCFKFLNETTKVICSCDKNDCEMLQFEWPQRSGQVAYVQSTRDGLRFEPLKPIGSIEYNPSDIEQPPKSRATIKISLDYEHQPILGWGGAFTDATCMNINKLSQPVRDKLIQSYFGKDGLQYNLGRVPIAGTDFSTRPYTYDDIDMTNGDDNSQPNTDFNLTQWNLAAEDREHKIPTIQRAAELSSAAGIELKLFGSSWSPPAWMKTSKSLVRGKLIDDEKVYDAYARYLVKFLRAYKDNGLNFWGATLQNEPYASRLPMYHFNSLQMDADQAVKFIVKHLGPLLQKEGYTKENFKLIVGDDSLGIGDSQTLAILFNEKSSEFVAGFAFHWYLSSVLTPYRTLSKVIESIKHKVEFVMMSEACEGSKPFSWTPVDMGSWQRAESYASDIIEDLLRGTNAWVDWNMALDHEGGPNWAHNYVDSPIIVDEDQDLFYKQPMYYALAHFSRFLGPGTVRVDTHVKDDTWFFERQQVKAVAAVNKQTGHLIVVILNKSDAKQSIDLVIRMTRDVNKPELWVEVEAKSISTIVLKL